MSALSAAERAELSAELENLARELRAFEEGTAAAAKPVTLDQSAVGRVSRIDAIAQQKMIEANRQAGRVRLQLVRSAQQRLARDEYGECLECGEEIAFRRLKARPEALFCLACQSAREGR